MIENLISVIWVSLKPSTNRLPTTDLLPTNQLSTNHRTLTNQPPTSEKFEDQKNLNSNLT